MQIQGNFFAKYGRPLIIFMVLTGFSVFICFEYYKRQYNEQLNQQKDHIHHLNEELADSITHEIHEARRALLQLQLYLIHRHHQAPELQAAHAAEAMDTKLESDCKDFQQVLSEYLAQSDSIAHIRWLTSQLNINCQVDQENDNSLVLLDANTYSSQARQQYDQTLIDSAKDGFYASRLTPATYDETSLQYLIGLAQSIDRFQQGTLLVILSLTETINQFYQKVGHDFDVKWIDNHGEVVINSLDHEAISTKHFNNMKVQSADFFKRLTNEALWGWNHNHYQDLALHLKANGHEYKYYVSASLTPSVLNALAQNSFSRTMPIVILCLLIILAVTFVYQWFNLKLLAQRAALTEEAQRNRLASQYKTQFLANMSHEIRTPMTAVLGMLEMLRNTKLNSTQQKYSLEIYSAARTLLMIINNILDVSKIESGKITLEKSTFSLVKILDTVIDLFSPSAELKHLNLRLSLDQQLPKYLKGDSVRLSQVLNNLIGNAIKFTHYGGVTLTVKLVDETSDNYRLLFSVEDTGIGIHPESMDRLFTPFEQLDDSSTKVYGGTGLGLSISKEIVELMGGELYVSSVVGEGSRFWFELSFETEEDHDRISEISHISKKVLLAEEDRKQCQLLTDMLQHWGCDVIRQSYLNEDFFQEDFDIYLFDRTLVEQKYHSVIEQLQQKSQSENKDIPVIIMTQESGWQLPENITTTGLNIELLIKPVTISKLLQVLERLGIIGQEEEDPDDYRLSQIKNEIQERLERRGLTRLLVVEDNLINRTIILEQFKEFPLEIDVASNGFEAVIKTGQERYDIIFMDLQMPVLDGFEATEEIRKYYNKDELPILALSAATFTDDVELAAKVGINDHLSKPFELYNLYAAFLRWLPK